VPRYWIDADVLIQAKNGLYSFDLAPPFWSFLDEQVQNGVICSSTKIYDEILRTEDSSDALANWTRNRRTNGMFIEPSRDVQTVYGQIADYVMEKYKQRQFKANEFLSGGDGWIIAHAKVAKGTVVSHEARVDRTALKPKIPNISTDFGVRCITLAEMLSELNFQFTSRDRLK
jgi:hypothetical protein